MKPPVNFFEINGKFLSANGMEFYIECNQLEEVWIFGDPAQDFNNCIRLGYDWPSNKFSIRICELGQGITGYDAETNLSILRFELLTMKDYLKSLTSIVEFHMNKLLKP